jgi:hypothetical protein
MTYRGGSAGRFHAKSTFVFSFLFIVFGGWRDNGTIPNVFFFLIFSWRYGTRRFLYAMGISGNIERIFFMH